MEVHRPPHADRRTPFPYSEAKRFATVSLSVPPSELPNSFMEKILAICASKVGSSDVDLASHLMITLNVSFKRRAGRLMSDVLIIKDPRVYRSGVGDAVASAKE